VGLNHFKDGDKNERASSGHLLPLATYTNGVTENQLSKTGNQVTLSGIHKSALPAPQRNIHRITSHVEKHGATVGQKHSHELLDTD
jgi:hypothetical protein